jgi:hypothetical protein
MSARTLILLAAVCAMTSAFAQAPSWNPSDGRNSSLPKPQPSGVVNKATGSAAAVNMQPPRDVDCNATITKPVDPYDPHPTKFKTDQTLDHGQILNAFGEEIIGVAHYLNDMQVRIEQLRCEERNTKAKLDFLIRTLVHE